LDRTLSGQVYRSVREVALWRSLRLRGAPYVLSPRTRSFGELLIDLEGDKAARAVVFGLLAEMGRE
jgi:hypothetical protein